MVYKFFKRIIVLVTFVVLIILSGLFLNLYKSEMLGGYTEIIYVESTADNFEDDLHQLVADYQLVLAKRIVESSNEDKGKLENTYVPIGSKGLPSRLPLQEESSLIRESSHQTLYIILEGNLDAQGLSEVLTQLGHEVIVHPTNYSLVLLRYLLGIPQTLLLVLVIVMAYLTLLLSEQIAELKISGIKRLAGYGKYHIALQHVSQDCLFILVTGLVTFLLFLAYLLHADTLSPSIVLMFLTPLVVWMLLLIMTTVVFSNLFYSILQKQPIALSVKGKAPMALVKLAILGTQTLTLLSLMLSFSTILSTDRELKNLEQARHHWENFADFSQFVMLDNDDLQNSDQFFLFFEELKEKTTVIYIEDFLDDKLFFQEHPNVNTYYPTAENISNVIYVNSHFLDQLSAIKISEAMTQTIQHLREDETVILIPSTLQGQYDILSQAWENFERYGLSKIDSSDKQEKHQVVVSAPYTSTAPLFIFPVFGSSGHLLSTEAFVHEPIIIVKEPDFVNLSADTILVKDSEQAKSLIKKYGLSSLFGSLTNGLYATQRKIGEVQNKRYLMLVAQWLAFISSLLLSSLMNSIYFYQNRQQFYIERLSGKGTLEIHRRYLFEILVAHLLVMILAFLGRGDVTLLVIPIGHLALVAVLFSVECRIEKSRQHVVVKGE